MMDLNGLETSWAFERYSSTYRVSDLHSTPMVSPVDSLPQERSITSGTCYGINWFCIHNITSMHFNSYLMIGTGTAF